MMGLFPKEEELMYAIWNIGHPCLISEILKKDSNLKRNTVAQSLVILERKGYLKVDSIGKSITRTGRAYAPVITKEAYEEQKELLQMVEKSPNSKIGILTFFSSLLEAKKVDEEFITQVESIINEFKKTNGEK